MIGGHDREQESRSFAERPGSPCATFPCAPREPSEGGEGEHRVPEDPEQPVASQEMAGSEP